MNWLNEINIICIINHTNELKCDWKLSCSNAHKDIKLPVSQSQRSQTEAVTFLANHDDSRALYAIPGE